MGFGKSSPKFSLNVFVGARWTSSPSLGGTAPSLGGGAPISSYTPFVSNVDPAADVTPATTLQFDLSGAVGLALKSSVSSASVRKSALGSNLVVVLESGLTREALSVGTASINKFIIAPNNRLYVLFNSATNFGSSTCILAQVNRATGKAVCLESQNLSVDLTTKNSIQFDSSGNIYYAGTRNWAKVLRRFSNGVAVDYINQYQSFDKWLVLPNGDVILGGSTAANGLSWTRRISVAGAVTPVSASSTRWLMFFPDGNAYFESDGCIKRYLTSGQLLDPTPWSGCVSGAYNREGVLAMFLNSFWITANAQVLAQYTNTSLYYLYPTIKKANQPLQRITYGIQALTSMVLVGTNATGTNQMVLFDSTNNSSSLLADGSNEIEFYRVQLNLAQNRVYFDGLRFADNKYVIGYLDLSNRTILSSDVLTRVQDFQTFVG